MDSIIKPETFKGDEHLSFIDDYYNEAIRKGLEEGTKSGIENGCQEQREKIARKLIEKNISIDKIFQITQLPVDFIKIMPGEVGCLEKLLQRKYDEAFKEGVEVGKKLGFKKGFSDEENRIKTELKKFDFSEEDVSYIMRYSLGDNLLYNDMAYQFKTKHTEDKE